MTAARASPTDASVRVVKDERGRPDVPRRAAARGGRASNSNCPLSPGRPPLRLDVPVVGQPSVDVSNPSVP